jgi:hypothetical protein
VLTPNSGRFFCSISGEAASGPGNTVQYDGGDLTRGGQVNFRHFWSKSVMKSQPWRIHVQK